MKVDLDRLNADDVARIYEVAKYRLSDPQLRSDIQRRVSEVGDDDLAALVVNALEADFPSEVLRVFQHELIPNLPTLGSFHRPIPQHATGPDEWLKADPRRLAEIVDEMSIYSTNWQTIALSIATLTDRLGITDEVATPIVTAALRCSIESHPHYEDRF